MNAQQFNISNSGEINFCISLMVKRENLCGPSYKLYSVNNQKDRGGLEFNDTNQNYSSPCIFMKPISTFIFIQFCVMCG